MNQNLLQTLHTWAQELKKANSIDEIYNHTLDAVEKIINCKHTLIHFIDGDFLKLIAYHGFSSTSSQKVQELSVQGSTVTAKAASTGTAILVHNSMDHPDYQRLLPSVKSELAVPMKIRGNVIGVISVTSKEPEAFDHQDQLLFETLASHASVAFKGIQERKKRVSLQRLVELRDQFLARAAHEINTPLTPIQTNLKMLKRGYYGKVTEEQQQHIDQVLESVEILERLVDNFRKVSKLRTTSISLEKEEINLHNIITKTLHTYQDSLQADEITVVKDLKDDLTVKADKERLTQVLRNLLENAIDYTQNTIWIATGSKEQSIWFSVRDDGPGIQKKEQEQIFQPFYQVKDNHSQKSRRFNSAGLGLTICKRIIEAHNGKIRVDSNLGEGTTFTVLLPKQEEKK